LPDARLRLTVRCDLGRIELDIIAAFERTLADSNGRGVIEA